MNEPEWDLPTFDKAVLSRNCDNDKPLERRVLQEFLRISPDLLAAISGTDPVKAAHSVKSSSRMIGAMKLGHLCEVVEKAGVAGPTELSQISVEFTNLLKLISASIEAMSS